MGFQSIEEHLAMIEDGKKGFDKVLKEFEDGESN